MKLTATHQYMILSFIIFCGILFAYYQFWLKPVNVQIAELSQTLEQKQKELKEAQEIVKKYAEFKKRADSVQRELEWLQSRMPSTIDKAKLMDSINLIRERSGVVITNFTMGELAAKDTYAELPVNLSFNSDYKGLLGFLYQSTLVNLYMTSKDLVIKPLVDANHPSMTLSAQITVSGVQSK